MLEEKDTLETFKTDFDFPMTPELDLLCEENYSLQNEQDIQVAINSGMEIIKNTDNLMTFDLDGEEALETFKSRVGFLERKGFSPKVEISKSKSGNYHATVSHSIKIEEPLRLAIQACLGSDWKREMLGVLRQINGQKDQVSRLFRPNPLEVVKWP